MKAVMFVATLLGALGSGIIGGLLFAFSSFVMRSLSRLPPEQGVRAMQTINLVIVTPSFLVVFVGTVALSLLLGGAALATAAAAPARPWLIAGSLLYLVGVIGVTAAFNIPRNDALAPLDPEGPAAAAAWALYVPAWTLWNHVRATAAIAASAAFIAAFRALPR